MTATLEAEKVVVNAEEIANPTVTATVVSGAEFITLDGLTVTAKASMAEWSQTRKPLLALN